MMVIELTKVVNVSWDSGYHLMPNKTYIKTERKINYIERLPISVRDLSTKVNTRNEMKDIDPIIMTLLREDELDAIKDGENVMVVGDSQEILDRWSWQKEQICAWLW